MGFIFGVISSQLFTVASPFIILLFFYQCQESIQNKDEVIYKRYGSLLEEFKSEKNIKPLMFYPCFFARRICYVFILYNLSSFPIMQVILNSVTTVCFMAYIWQNKPFAQMKLNYFYLVQEMSVLASLVLIGFFIGDLDETSKEIVGYLVIVVAGMAIILGYSYAIVSSIIEVKKLCRARQRAKVQTTKSETIFEKSPPPQEENNEYEVVRLNFSIKDEQLDVTSRRHYGTPVFSRSPSDNAIEIET